MTSDPVARFLAVRAAKVERRARLRPMTSGELLDSSLGVARNLGVQLLRVSLNPSFFCLAALVFVFGYALPQIQYTQQPNSTVGQIEETIATIALAIFVGGPIFLLGATYAGGVVIKLTSDFMLGRTAEVELAESEIRGRLGTLFVCGLRELCVCFGTLLASGAILMLSGALASVTSSDNSWVGLLALLGGLCFVSGCAALLFLFARRAIMFPIVILEGVGVRAASGRMKILMKQTKNQPSGAGAGAVGNMYAISLLVFAVIYGGVSLVFSAFDIDGMVRGWTNHSMLEPLFGTAVSLAPAFCAIWVLLPFWAVVLTVLYYERRIRVEGFDIEQLAEEIGRDGRTNRFNV